jgi:hypothetical protein
MPTYQPYSPDQAELLPAHVKDVLGCDHLCFVVHEKVEACGLVVLSDGEIPAETLVWTVGTSPNPLLRNLPVERDAPANQAGALATFGKL